MLRLPSFVSALIGSDTQSEALLAEQDVSAVTGVNGDDGVILRELADIYLFSSSMSHLQWRPLTQSSLSPRASSTFLPTLVIIAMLSTT